ncbi:hypothetical protein DF037_05780 [Burkholderia contaminans]|uniref:Uncharacterized protein n=1 Tax=Burkholderia contaminans TaxID=488447 RepID=A0A3N8RGE9_9BURK|nr:hypothetical protein DF037_05780 [Burkholderia contaminans]
MACRTESNGTRSSHRIITYVLLVPFRSLFLGRNGRDRAVECGLTERAFQPSRAGRPPDALNLRKFCIAAPGPTPA